MTTAYSTNLGLALPVQGELSGTWGDTVNNGITQYSDISIAGTLTLNGDGAVTLSLTNGNAAGTNIGSTTAQYAVLRITGTLTATKVITAPSSSKIYLVDNASSGGFGVTIKASGQTGYTVAASTKAYVYFNGTDYVLASTNDVSKLSGLLSLATQVTGTLPVANGGTGAATLTANNVLLGNGTSALQVVAPGTSGNVLTSNGTTWQSTAPTGVTTGKSIAMAMIFGF